MSPKAQKVIDRLDHLRQKWWVFTMLSSTVWAMSASLFLFLLLACLDSLFLFSQVFLGIGLSVWLLSTICLVTFVLRRIMGCQRSLEGTARCVETENPELESHLINLVQLSSDQRNVDRDFCRAAVDQAAGRADSVSFDNVAAKETRFRRFLYSLQTPRDFVEACCVLAFFLFLSFLGSAMLPNWSSAASRFTQPWKFVPSVGSVKITAVKPGDKEILLGTSLEITVETDEPITDTPFTATLFIQPDGADGEEKLPMPLVLPEQTQAPVDIVDAERAVEANTEQRIQKRYSLVIPVVAKSAKYRIEVGNSQSQKYQITVLEKPTIAEAEVVYTYLPYMNRVPETVSLRTMPDLTAPQYTTAQLRIKPSAPITSGQLEWVNGSIGTGGSVSEDGMLFTARIDIVQNTSYKIRLQRDGNADPEPRVNNIRFIPDEKPRIDMVRPTGEISIAPGQNVPIAAKLFDDFGISAAWLEVKVNDIGLGSGDEEATSGTRSRDAAVRPIYKWPIDENGSPQQYTAECTLQITDEPLTVELFGPGQLPMVHAKPGQEVRVRVVATDNRSYTNVSQGIDWGPQKTEGAWRIIKVTDKDTASKETQELIGTLRDAIRKLMEKQVRNQLRTLELMTKKTLDDRTTIAGADRTLQVEISIEAARIVKSIPADGRPEDQMIKRDLNRLVFEEMTQAVETADLLVKSTTVEAFEEPATKLHALQGKIVEALRNMMRIARSAEAKAIGEMIFRNEDDLPDDVVKKMQSLKDALDEAIAAQRKVVDAANNLNKENVEDFAEMEEQLIKQIQAAEDAWEKFMNELNTDLSKLPFQDFSNPSLLQEMVEIQTEIKKKNGEEGDLGKCADIAVPLEQLGTEMAEEIKTNMEKWLPDGADRERWSQEETVNDDEKEAPMAELPLELEDLIGELLEEEEDLFDEMEDISSSMIDSLDAGAGWDVLDGPISNNSAKGSTGNRLPNTNEIAGRSGEGRQGKSGGEFVGEEAVGKGGRNTPTRLTPDAFQKGQIRDHSKDPVGGATGGGKEAGDTDYGLEGPQARNRGERDNNRLASKQADLRNRMEGIDLNHFNVKGFHNEDIAKMKDAVDQTMDSIRGGYYAHAQRQIRIALGFGADAKKYLGNEFYIKEDQTLNLPTNVQEQLFSGFDDPSPIGWESVNREYFRKLSEGTQ